MCLRCVGLSKPNLTGEKRNTDLTLHNAARKFPVPPCKTRAGLLWVNFYRFDGHQTMSGMLLKADLFRQNVWIAPNIGLFSPLMKTVKMCHNRTFAVSE
jgi:hypothetical protein